MAYPSNWRLCCTLTPQIDTQIVILKSISFYSLADMLNFHFLWNVHFGVKLPFTTLPGVESMTNIIMGGGVISRSDHICYLYASPVGIIPAENDILDYNMEQNWHWAIKGPRIFSIIWKKCLISCLFAESHTNGSWLHVVRSSNLYTSIYSFLYLLCLKM